MKKPYWGILLVIILVLPRSAHAVTIASQTQGYQNLLTVHQVIQELGNNLSGQASSFTFRVSTAKSNSDQFNYTIQGIRIYDKDNNNSSIVGCTPPNYNPADPLGALTFTTTGVPSGYEDVTIDFSCRNYNFTAGHKYLITIGQGNGLMLLAGAAYGPGGNDQFPDGGLRYGNGNRFDIKNGGGDCDPIKYKWNDPALSPKSGCNVWTSPGDDLYFILTNTSPPSAPPKLPVIFIPGIGGSELKANQDIVWSKDDGHGGNFSHRYTSGEKIWVNQSEAVKLGHDDYFDVLRLKEDGQTSEADLTLTGDLTPFGYSEIDSFFIGMGYSKGTNFFVFPYDWRKDIRTTQGDLDSLIETAKQKSGGQSQVNLVVHSMGGLVARYYISDASKASKVNKLIELGVPHLGTVDALKAMMYGKPLGRQILGDFYLGVPSSEVNDLFQNFTSAFQLLPSKLFYSFYNDSNPKLPFPFSDERDIDNNQEKGTLNYNELSILMKNLNFNTITFNNAEQFHDLLDNSLHNPNNVKLYEIAGSNQPTLGQIREIWLINWPIQIIPVTDEVFINGDGTVPLYSALLKDDTADLSGGATTYYVEQKHSNLVSSTGTAMGVVKSILLDDSLPVEVKSEKISLEGQQLTVDQNADLNLYDDQGRFTGVNSSGEIEINIPETFYSVSGNSRHAFVKKNSPNIKVKITANSSSNSQNTNLKIRYYQDDSVNKTTLYKDIPVSNAAPAEIDINSVTTTSPPLSIGGQSMLPTAEVSGDSTLDQNPPSTGVEVSGSKDSSGSYNSSATITFNGSDSESGILEIEYSLDNGQTVQTYTGPFTITNPGQTTIQIKAIDKVGNEEIPQTLTININANNTTSGSNSNETSTNNSSEISNTQQLGVSTINLNNPVTSFGVSFQNPLQISEGLGEVLGANTTSESQSDSKSPVNNRSLDPNLNKLLKIALTIIALAGFVLVTTFLKPSPK